MIVRTTIRVDEDLFKEARKKAIDERVAFADIVNDALSLYLEKSQQTKKKLTGIEFLEKLSKYNLKNAPKDLAKNHDKYLWQRGSNY